MPHMRPVSVFIDLFPSLDRTIIEAIYLSALVSGASGTESTITDDQLVDELLKICSDDEPPPQPAPSARQQPPYTPTGPAKPHEVSAASSRSTPTTVPPPLLATGWDPPRLSVAAVQAETNPQRPQDYAPVTKPSPPSVPPQTRDAPPRAAPASPAAPVAPHALKQPDHSSSAPVAPPVAPHAIKYPPIAAVLMVWDYDNLPPPHRPAQTVFQAIRAAVEQACTAHPKFSGIQPLASWEKIAFYVGGHCRAMTDAEHEDLRTLSVSTICCTKRKEDADRQISAKVQEEVRKYLRRDASAVAGGGGGPLQDMLVVLLSSDKDFCHLVEETGQRGFPVCVVHDADPGSRHELSLRTFPAFDLPLRQLLGPCVPRGGHVGERRQGAVVRFNTFNRIGDIVDRQSREVLFFICDDPDVDVGCDVEYALAPDLKKPGKMKAVRVQRVAPASATTPSAGGGAVKLLSPSAVAAAPRQPWVHGEPPPVTVQAPPAPAVFKKQARQDFVNHEQAQRNHHDPNIFAALDRRSSTGGGPNGQKQQQQQQRHRQALSTPPSLQDDSDDDMQDDGNGDGDDGSPSSPACPPIPPELVQQVKDMSGAVDTAWVKFCLAAAVRNGEVDAGLAVLHATGTPIKSRYRRRVERGYGWRCPAATPTEAAGESGAAVVTAACNGAPPPQAAAGLDGLAQDDPEGFLFGRLAEVAQQLGLPHCTAAVIQRCIRAAGGQYDLALDLMLAADGPPPAPRPVGVGVPLTGAASAVPVSSVTFGVPGHGGAPAAAASSQAQPLRPAAAQQPGRPSQSSFGGFVGMNEPD